MATTDRRGVSVDATDSPTAYSTDPGLAIKIAARVATTANIALSGLQTIDGVVLAEGNRVLVKNQTDAKQNGLYSASSGAWTRTSDANSNARLIAGMLVVVTAGTANQKKIFELVATDPVVLGTSTINFEVASGSGSTDVAATSLFGNPTGVLAAGISIALGATLLFSGTTLQTAAMSGDVATSANSFVTTIQPNVVSNAKLRQSAALSLMGNATNATANVDDIAASLDNQVMRRSGTAIGFGAINLASANAVSGSLPAANGGTGATSLGAEFTVAANVFHVANNGITYALFQQVAASSLVGNPTGGLANAQGITLGATLAFSGSALQTAALTGDVTASANSFVTTVAKIQGTTVSGTTGTVNVAFSASPTFTGAPVLAAPSATTLAVGTTSLAGYVVRIVGGNANQLAIDNTGQQYTELDYSNNGTIKVTTYWDNTSNAFVFRSVATGAFIAFDTRNSGGTLASRMRIQASGGLSLGSTILTTDPGGGSLNIAGGFASAPPTTKTGNYTQLTTDSSLIFNGAGSITLTLLSAASYPGRELLVKTIAAQTVVSASANVIPLAGGAAGTAILAATAGKWALLKSDGANWQIMAAA